MAMEVKVFPEQITIENFKSIKRITLKLKPGINLLVGPNRAGKTNILEAIYFLSKALSREELLKIPYAPHLPQYWSPEDIFFMKNVNTSIRFEILFRIVTRYKDKYVKHYVGIDVAFALAPNRSSIEPAQLVLDFKTLKFVFNKEGVDVLINRNYLDMYLQALEELNNKEISSTLLQQIKSIKSKLLELKERAKEVKDEFLLLYSIPIEQEFTKFINSLLLTDFAILFRIYHAKQLKDDSKILYLLVLRPLIAINRHRIVIPLIILHKSSDVAEFKGCSITFPLFDEDFMLYEYIINIIKRTLRALENVILLKHPDVGAISEPQPFGSGERLDVRARNLPQILYKLAAERRINTIEKLLRDIFGDVSIEPRSAANRVFFVVREGSIELPPPNIADGVIKVLAIATAVELNPSILLIDEIENSLHVEAIQKIFDFLNSLEIPVLVATHSPAVIDLVDLDRVIIVSRGLDGATNVEYIEDVEGVRKRLIELGVSYSEYILYSKTVK